MDEERKKWLETLPPIVRAVAERFNSDDCYRMTSNDGHYRIVSYGSNGTLKLAHGRDSYAPGIGVFGVNPDEVVRCGCGKWEIPTQAQMEAQEQEVLRLRADRAARAKHN